MVTVFFNIDTKDLPAKPADPSKKITLANAATNPFHKNRATKMVLQSTAAWMSTIKKIH